MKPSLPNGLYSLTNLPYYNFALTNMLLGHIIMVLKTGLDQLVQLRTKHQSSSIIIKNQKLKKKSKKNKKLLVQLRKLGIVMVKMVLVFEE